MRVIVRSNDSDRQYWVGTYIGKDPNCHNVSVVVTDDGVRCYVLGIIVPYSAYLAAWLDTMDPQTQWDELRSMKRFWADN